MGIVLVLVVDQIAANISYACFPNFHLGCRITSMSSPCAIALSLVCLLGIPQLLSLQTWIENNLVLMQGMKVFLIEFYMDRSYSRTSIREQRNF
jgi:hypothetical protein